MNNIEVFENLVEPLKYKLSEDDWNFLLGRGVMFINQCIVIKPIQQLHYTLLLEIANMGKEHPDMLVEDFRKLPEVQRLFTAIDVITPYIEKD